MSTPFTADPTIIAAAENLCEREAAAGRVAIFEPLHAGLETTFRQRRLFEFAMLRWQTRGDSELHLLACAGIDRTRSPA